MINDGGPSGSFCKKAGKMFKKILSILFPVALLFTTWAWSIAHDRESSLLQTSLSPSIVSYQGKVMVNNAPYNGVGYFKFAIVNAAGNHTYWSNDGSSTAGSEPAQAVPLDVEHGLFSVFLGDTNLSGMTQSLTPQVFAASERYLRIWFRAASSGAFERLTPDVCIGAVPYALQAQHAAPPAFIIVVANNNGDFSSIQQAIDSLPGAPSPSNPVLIWIAPGFYNEAVKLKPNVHLQGAGQGLTYIQANASNGAVLTLANSTSVRDLNTSNIGTGPNNYGIFGENVTDVEIANVLAEAGGSGVSNTGIYLTGTDTELTLKNVTAWGLKGSSSNIGLSLTLGPQVTVHGGTFSGSGGQNAYGIWVAGGNDTFLGAADVHASGSGASTTNVGLSNSNSATVFLQGSFLMGSGGQYAYGIENYYGARLEAEGVTAQAENGSSSTAALYSHDESQTTLRGGSYIAQGNGTGSAKGIHLFGSNTFFEAHDVTSLANGSSLNYGLLGENNSPLAHLYGGTFIGRGGAGANGIRHNNLGELTIQGAFVLAENSTTNYGLYVGGGTVRADACRFKGSTAAIYANGGTVYLAVSKVDGGAQRFAGTYNCFQVYSGNYTAFTCP